MAQYPGRLWRGSLPACKLCAEWPLHRGRLSGLLMGSPHPSGGCAMGRDSHDSVVDSSHRVHGLQNLFVSDSSVFPTSVSVDPSFTIMGFSYLAAEHVHAALA